MMVNVGGAYEDQQDSFKDLGMLMLLSLILVLSGDGIPIWIPYDPVCNNVLCSILLYRVIWALFITNTTLSVIAAMGAVLLIGIVVKNGIVLVDYINLMRARGYEMVEAIASPEDQG